jgi:DNA-directed RNA polymerase specialized sigma24 family protein
MRRVSGKVWNRADAENIGQLTALYVWQHIDTFDPARSSISNWIRLTADSMLNDHLEDRYKRKGNIEFDHDSMEVAGGEAKDDRHAGQDKLRYAFGEDQELLNLLLMGYTAANCEGKLGLTRKTIRCRMDKAKKRGESYNG